MPTIAGVTDGIVTSGVNKALSEEKATGAGSSLDKDAFLQLLVAEMENQDPLDSQDNTTEYIAQLATFSELEAMQNLQTTAENMNYESMLGKTVTMNVDNNMITGQVDDIIIQDGATKFSIDGEYYDAEDLYQVIDSDYLSAYTKASNIVSVMKDLPKNPDTASHSELDSFGTIAESYYNMSEYEKSFLTDDMKAQLDSYVKAYEKYKGESLNPQKAMVDKMVKESDQLKKLLEQMIAAQSTTNSSVNSAGTATTDAIKELQDAITKLENQIEQSSEVSDAAASANASDNENASSEESAEVTEEMLDAILSDQDTK